MQVYRTILLSTFIVCCTIFNLRAQNNVSEKIEIHKIGSSQTDRDRSVVTMGNVWYNEEANLLRLEFYGSSFLEVHIVDISSNSIIFSDIVGSSYIIPSPSNPGSYLLIIESDCFYGIASFIKH
ncbi:MAG: hypothetical protein J6R25_05565 [Bacteroidales bacterium]|nr:hypothetical protein [Bacteroidales bacterium]